MEKLTKERFAEIIRDKEICEFCEDCGNDEICINCEKVNPATVAELRLFWKELAALVKARDEGRVVVLPCKVGDTLYTESPIRGMVTSFKAPDLAWIIENISEFGKTVFLTRAEAEAARLKGGPHEADPV